MKAKRKSDGKIIEVREWRGASNVVYSTLDMNEFYQESDLDFLPEKETAVLEGWICKDGKYFGDGGFLRLFIGSKPYRIADEEIQSWDGEDSLRLPYILLPSVTWESEPKRVRITIEEIE